jgi:branched-chain amino acid transport system substrate-binding protein
MKNKKAMLAVALGTAAVLGLAACSGAGSPSSGGSSAKGGTFKVVMIAGVTGPLGPTTADMELGLKTAAAEVNKAGGINGEKVTVSVVDDKGDPTQGVTALQTLLTSGGQAPNLVYAGIGSSETLAMLPLLTQSTVFSMSQTTDEQIDTPSKNPYHFGVNPTNPVSLAVIGQTIKAKGYKKVSIVVPSNAYGDDLQTTVTALAKSAGAKVVDTERFDPNAVDYTVQYQRALAAHPDVVFADSTGTSTAAQMFSARQTAGGMSTPLIVGNGFSALVPSKVAPSGSAANCEMPVADYVVQGKSNAKLIGPLAAAVKAHGQTGSIYIPGMAFDMVRFAAFAAKKAGSTDTKAMAKALQTNKIPAGYSVLYPKGFSYSSKTHFPSAAAMEMLPCTSTIVDNTFWKPAS